MFLEQVRPPEQRGLVRGRLEAKIAGLRPDEPGSTLALVLGPPGSGKTTLLGQLAATGPSAWYRLGPEDTDEASIARHLGFSLGAAIGDHDLIAAAGSGRIADLIGALDDRAQPRSVRLVVDDLHAIAGTPAEQALGTLVFMRPRSVRIVLGSRRPPQINTSRLLVSGELVEVDADDLRFRSWEVEQLFRTVYDAPLTPEGAAALTRRVGGWAAGLQLFHLATAHLGRAERERAIDALSGRSRLIRSYLTRNVLDGLDSDRRRFLLLTSTLGVLTGDLCDDLLETSGSAGVLAALEEEQFFTSSTDGGITYRYHQVLQTQLEVLLAEELGGRAARGWYARSGQLLEDAGRIGAAVHAYARAEEWGSVARLLQPSGAQAVDDHGLWATLCLPGVPVDDPGLVLARARQLARRGELPDAVAAYRRAEELLDDPEFTRRCAQERQAVMVWLADAATPAVPTAGPPGLSAQLRALTRSARAATSDPLARGLQCLLTGDLDAAAAVLAEPGPGDPWRTLASRLAERWIDLLRGPDEASAGEVEPIMLDADVDGWPWLSRIARGLQAAMLLAADPTDWRVASAREVLDTLDRRRDPWTACLTSLALGVGFAQAGRDDEARRAFAGAAGLADGLDAPALRTWAGALAAGRRSGESGAGRPRPSGDAGGPSRPDRAVVELACLGGFSLTVDGVDVDWRDLRPRSRSLLMLLAMRHGQLVHREALIDALWPQLSLTSGVHSLQVAVSSIRQCLARSGLGEEALRRQGDAYALVLPGAVDQVSTFERLAADAAREPGPAALRRRTAALDLYTGDLLPEAGPAEWVVAERDRLRRLASSVAAAAAADALAAGDARTALTCARRATALDPYQDSSWELVVESGLRLGDQAAVAAARREQARAWAELGLAEVSAGSRTSG